MCALRQTSKRQGACMNSVNRQNDKHQYDTHQLEKKQVLEQSFLSFFSRIEGKTSGGKYIRKESERRHIAIKSFSGGCLPISHDSNQKGGTPSAHLG
jgi:hypothetical protein